MIDSSEKTRMWRVAGLGDLELLQASYRSQNFGPHFHDGFLVGVIRAGALGYRYLGRDNVASAGEINLALPGEVHNGFAAVETGWRYRMFYFGPGQFEELVLADPQAAPPRARIARPKILDRDLALRLLALHRSLENPGLPLLAHESGLVGVMTELVRRYAEKRPTLPAPGREPLAVARIKEYIRTNFEENVSLTDLSRETGLSRYHLLRTFKKATGLPPHAYLLQVRTERAKSLLRRGRSISEAAYASGFADQSHLNRVFKRIHGITPGFYRNIVQDPTPCSCSR